MQGSVRSILVVVAVVTLTPTVGAQDAVTNAASVEQYVSAIADDDGTVRIMTTDGRTIRIPPDPDEVVGRKQQSTQPPVISSDRTAVGAIARYGDEAIPLALLVYSRGKVHRFRGDGSAFWAWRFEDGGSRIAYRQSTLHLVRFESYELRDVETEQLVDAIDIPYGYDPASGCCEAGFGWRGGKVVPVPEWVRKMAEERPRY